jgi:hypothetical protein
MFNLKKKIVNSFKDQNEIIAEIHEEFDSSTERLLNEAKEILSKNDSSKIEKANRLKRIGFSSSKTVEEAQEQVNAAAKSKELSENIVYFKQHYPFNKFINETEVERICKKYGLLCGEASKYIGEIPEKNLSEIEAFKLRKEDLQVKYSYMGIDDLRSQLIWESFRGRQNIFGGLQSRSYLQQSMPLYQAKSDKREDEYEKPEFKICAPVKDFNTEYMSIEDGYKLSNIPDPIVLQPVKGGYLIVSKWGLEGEDKELVNEVLN